MQQKAKYPHLISNTLNLLRSSRIISTMIGCCAAMLSFMPVQTFAEPSHGVSMHGELKYPAGFTHFSYVNPDAPQSGKLKLAMHGSFNSFNPFIPKGVPAPYLRDYVYQSLMGRARDEPFSLYGLLAEKIDMPEDRSWVSFTLRKEARFSDGKPVTADDVIFSFKLLKEQGRPNHRTFYSKVQEFKKIGDNTVKFIFKDGKDRELALIMGLMPILPKHAVKIDEFPKTSLKKPIGSGPYLLDSFTAGKQIVYRKNPNYWGSAVPATKGKYNFDEVQVSFYRNKDTRFEAFKNGLSHQWIETDPSKWHSAYNFNAIRSGNVLKKEIDLQIPSGMNALVFNTRREKFADIRVRQALIYMFNFEWINKALYHNLYTRTQSYFDRSELSSHGKPADELELKLLAEYKDKLDQDILKGAHRLPTSNGSGSNRKNIRKALRLFKAAGYSLNKGKLINNKTGKQFSFEILLQTREQERLTLTYATELRKIGIDIKLRLVDNSQYEARKLKFDFDMLQFTWGSSLSPGNEQTFRWGAESASNIGSWNYPGVKSKAVDALINALLAAKSRSDFVSSVRALDRVLLSERYVIPLYHPGKQWLAHWKQIKCPAQKPLLGHLIEACWMEQ